MSDAGFEYSPVRSMLASSEEDRFTEYLAHLLKESELLARFLGLCRGLRIPDDDFPMLRVNVQVRIEGGRPDLVIAGERSLAIFEAKVGSWIHGNQIKEYAGHIRNWKKSNPAGVAGLFLIAPDSQLHALLVQAREDAGRLKVGGIAWEKIGDTVRETSRIVTSRRLQTHMQDFADLIDYRLGEAGRPFTAEEILVLSDRQFASALNRAYLIIKPITEGLKNEFGDCIGIKKSNGMGFTGYAFEYAGNKFWFGVWMHTWAAIGGSPLCLQIFQHVPHDLEWPGGMSKPAEGKWNGRIMPIDIAAQVERDELTNLIVKHIASIIRILNP